LIISCLALVGAWGGPAVAARLITSKDVKDRSLSGRDLRSNTITGRTAGNLSGRDLLPDSVDGTDILESSLGQVPRAREAAHAEAADTAARATVASALSGAAVARVHFARPAGSEAQILDAGGLRLKASCNASSAMTVTASTDSGNGWIRVSGTMQQAQNSTAAVLLEDDEFKPGDEFNVLPANADNIAGQIVHLAGDGSTVTVSFLAEQGVAPSRGYACLFAGTAVQAGA
jgi:hypothetical protein